MCMYLLSGVVVFSLWESMEDFTMSRVNVSSLEVDSLWSHGKAGTCLLRPAVLSLLISVKLPPPPSPPHTSYHLLSTGTKLPPQHKQHLERRVEPAQPGTLKTINVTLHFLYGHKQFLLCAIWQDTREEGTFIISAFQFILTAGPYTKDRTNLDVSLYVSLYGVLVCVICLSWGLVLYIMSKVKSTWIIVKQATTKLSKILYQQNLVFNVLEH